MCGKIFLQTHCTYSKKRAGFAKHTFLQFCSHIIREDALSFQMSFSNSVRRIGLTGLLKREENLSWLLWVQQDRVVFCLLIYQRLNNREVRKLLSLICTLRAWEKRVWIYLGYRLEEAVGTTDQMKVKMELNRFVLRGLQGTGDSLTMSWIWQPKRPHPALHRPDTTSAETSDSTEMGVKRVVRMPSIHGFLQTELCFSCRGGLEIQLGLDAHFLETGNSRVRTAPLAFPVFFSICLLIGLNLNSFPHPLAPSIFDSSRWNGISRWCKAW